MTNGPPPLVVRPWSFGLRLVGHWWGIRPSSFPPESFDICLPVHPLRPTGGGGTLPNCEIPLIIRDQARAAVTGGPVQLAAIQVPHGLPLSHFRGGRPWRFAS